MANEQLVRRVLAMSALGAERQNTIIRQLLDSSGEGLVALLNNIYECHSDAVLKKTKADHCHQIWVNSQTPLVAAQADVLKAEKKLKASLHKLDCFLQEVEKSGSVKNEALGPNQTGLQDWQLKEATEIRC